MRSQRGRLTALFAVLLTAGTGCADRHESGDTSEASGSEEISEALPQRPEDTEVWEPEPAIVTPGREGTAPSDAIILFDGTDLTGWTHEDGSDARWSIEDGVMTVAPGTGNIHADPQFADADCHLASGSPCIDTGDPADSVGAEPKCNGDRINMGAYGGTPEASKTYFGGPICKTIVAGDINGDGQVNRTDLEIMALHWTDEEPLLP